VQIFHYHFGRKLRCCLLPEENRTVRPARSWSRLWRTIPSLPERCFQAAHNHYSGLWVFQIRTARIRWTATVAESAEKEYVNSSNKSPIKNRLTLTGKKDLEMLK
jgi:hypothetical protein